MKRPAGTNSGALSRQNSSVHTGKRVAPAADAVTFDDQQEDPLDMTDGGGGDESGGGGMTTINQISSIHQNRSSATAGAASFASSSTRRGSSSVRSRSGTALHEKRLALPAGNHAPPPLVSRNVIINRYAALEKDSRAHDRLYQRGTSTTLPHTPTTLEREKAQRRRIPDADKRTKRVNAELPQEVSIGGVGRDLTLLNIVQQLDLNACGSDACALGLRAARSVHVTDVVSHSQSEFHWRRNPFADVVRVQHDAGELVNATASAKRQAQQQQQGDKQSAAKQFLSFFTEKDGGSDDDDDDDDAGDKQQQQQNQYRVSQAVLSGALAKSNVRTLPVDDRSVRMHRADVAPTDLAKAKRAGALESRLRHRLHLLIDEERRQHHAEMVRSGELRKDEDVVMSSVEDPNAPLQPIIVNREASWMRLIYIGVFASELKGQIAEVKATKLLRRVFAREMYRYLRRKRLLNEREQFEKRMKAEAFAIGTPGSPGAQQQQQQQQRMMGGGGPSSPFLDNAVRMPGAEVVQVVTTGPDGERIERAELRPSPALLLKCFGILKLDPDGYASPAVLLAAALAQRRGAPLAKVIGVNDEGIHGMPRMRISPEHLRLLGSVFRPAVFKKREPIIWNAPPPLSSSSGSGNGTGASYLYQQQQQQAPPRNPNDTEWWSEVGGHVHLIQSGIVRMIFRTSRKQAASTAAGEGANNNNNSNNAGGGKHGSGGGAAAAAAAASDIMPAQLTRRCVSGVETLTPGHVIGFEVLVPEQAKRYVAIADSDVATWCAPIKDLVAILDQINPYPDPDLDADSPRNKRKAAALAAAANAAAASPTTAQQGMMMMAAAPSSPEQVLQHRIERDCSIMLGRLLQRTVLLRKQEIFLAQTPPTPAFLRGCAPLLHTWSDGGLTELCRALDAIFVEKGTVVPLRKDRPNRGYQWFYVGGSAAVGEGVVVPPTTAPPSHVDFVYFVVHGQVAIMGRKVFEGKSKSGGGGDNSPGSPASATTRSGAGSGGSGGASQKLVHLDTIKPGQSFGVPSCLLGTLLDTATPSAICAAISAGGTPTSSAGKSAQSKAAAAAALVSSATGGSNANADVAIVANAAPVVLSAALASNITTAQLSHLVGIELHATQDAVLWKLSKNVLMHVLAHEHIGTLLSPYALYQQQGKPPSA